MNKKSLLAIAITSAAFSNVALAAPTADIYGFVDIGVQSDSTSDQEFKLTNGTHSRLGVKGEEALESGWKGSYRLEFKADVLNDGGYGLNTRLGWLKVENGAHSFKVGAQWSVLMNYSGALTARSEAIGVNDYLYIVEELPGSLKYGYRNSNTANYSYNAGGLATTIALHIADDTRTVTSGGEEVAVNDNGITGVSLGASYAMGDAKLSAAYVESLVGESEAAKAAGNKISAPVVYSLGAQYQVLPAMDVAVVYRAADLDNKTLTTKSQTKSSISAQTQYQLNDAWNVHLGYGVGDNSEKTATQMKGNVFAQVWYQASESRSARIELERTTTDTSTTKEAVQNSVLLSMRQTF